jgi:hypothetical protein
VTWWPADGWLPRPQPGGCPMCRVQHEPSGIPNYCGGVATADGLPVAAFNGSAGAPVVWFGRCWSSGAACFRRRALKEIVPRLGYILRRSPNLLTEPRNPSPPRLPLQLPCPGRRRRDAHRHMHVRRREAAASTTVGPSTWAGPCTRLVRSGAPSPS